MFGMLFLGMIFAAAPPNHTSFSFPVAATLGGAAAPPCHLKHDDH
jgi:hypothetical protein